MEQRRYRILRLLALRDLSATGRWKVSDHRGNAVDEESANYVTCKACHKTYKWNQEAWITKHEQAHAQAHANANAASPSVEATTSEKIEEPRDPVSLMKELDSLIAKALEIATKLEDAQQRQYREEAGQGTTQLNGTDHHHGKKAK